MVKDCKVKSKPIGIFDSGVGGLTVLEAIEKCMPGEDVVYFGDTARVPYGNKSFSTIKRFSLESVLFLLEQNVKIVVVACNTASALTLDYLNRVFRVPIIGVIDAGVKKALAVTSGKIGVIGTRSTIESKSYQKAIVAKNKKIKVVVKSCPLFVPFIEEGLTTGPMAREVVRMYLEDFKKKNVDTVILGCTHYPLLKKELIGFLDGCKVVDSAQEVAVQSKEVLQRLKLENKTGGPALKKFFVSDESDNFQKLAKLFLKRAIKKPRLADV